MICMLFTIEIAIESSYFKFVTVKMPYYTCSFERNFEGCIASQSKYSHFVLISFK